MENATKYHFQDFTHNHYRELLTEAGKHYNFCFYPESESVEGYVLWRHDLDYSMDAAVDLARIEAEAGVTSTYFLLPHSEYYNLLDVESKEAVKAILKEGHQLGLHFDAAYFNLENEADLEKALALEKHFLESIFDVEISVFSFHNPTPQSLQWQEWTYAGMINTYATMFREQVGYCSDSNGYWRHERMMDVLKSAKHKNLQILTHPEWWTEKVMSPKERIRWWVESKTQRSLNNYDQLLQSFERENIDW